VSIGPTNARACALILVLKPASLICSESLESSTSESRTHGAAWWLRYMTVSSARMLNRLHWPPSTAMFRPRTRLSMLKPANCAR
jgi:hypothetical protein